MFKGKNRVLIVAFFIIAGAALGLIVGIIIDQLIWSLLIGSGIGVITGSMSYLR